MSLKSLYLLDSVKIVEVCGSQVPLKSLYLLDSVKIVEV